MRFLKLVFISVILFVVISVAYLKLPLEIRGTTSALYSSLKAPTFLAELALFTNSDQQDVIDEFSNKGYELKCRGDLNDESEKIGDSDYLCLAYLNKAYSDISARSFTFFFREEKLAYVQIDFSPDTFNELNSYLDTELAQYPRMDLKDESNFRMDSSGTLIKVWEVENGYVFTRVEENVGRTQLVLWSHFNTMYKEVPQFDDVDKSDLLEPVSENSCVDTTKEISVPKIIEHFQWTDENGVVNFSSTKPKSSKVEVLDIKVSDASSFLQVKVDFRGDSFDALLGNKLTVEITAIYEVLAQWIGVERLRKAELNYVIFPNREEYLQYASKIKGWDPEHTRGYYTPRENEAVTYLGLEEEGEILSIARHEGVHIIMNNLFGNTPNWLNEGLAEYFRSINVSNQFLKVDMHEGQLQAVTNSLINFYPKKMTNYLSLTQDEWVKNKYHNGAHYSLGWSLVYFLVGSPEGKNSISALLQALAESCSSISGIKILDQTYPGGFNQLQVDYVKWLNDRKKLHLHQYVRNKR